jgi:hypothetical protein
MGEANPNGYNFQVTVTSGHEAEAKAAEMAKKPNRLGMFIVNLLKGKQGSALAKTLPLSAGYAFPRNREVHHQATVLPW